MPLSSVVIIVLRLFSVLWLVQGVAMFAQAASVLVPYPAQHTSYWSYAAPASLIVIAHVITPRPNPTLVLGELATYDLYCFAFTFLGLYFVLSSVGEFLNRSHEFLVFAPITSASDPRRQDALYKLTKPLVTLLAGGASLAFSPRCAEKLTRLQSQREAS